jgi:signal transduction histidine kinase
MMCLQEEMIYLKRILCLKGDPNLNIEFNLKDFLTEIASLFSFQADMRGIDFQIIFDNNLSSNIQSDPYKIKIILVNLLSKIIVLSYKIT